MKLKPDIDRFLENASPHVLGSHPRRRQPSSLSQRLSGHIFPTRRASWESSKRYRTASRNFASSDESPRSMASILV